MNSYELYKRSPYCVQTALLNLYAVKMRWRREGRPFKRHLDKLTANWLYTPEQIADLQNARLRVVVTHAYATVPYYRQLFDSLHLGPEDVQSYDDLRHLPILDKDSVRSNFDQLLSTSFPRRSLATGSTSGTTGSPLTVAWDRTLQAINHAADWRQKRLAGIDVGDRIAMLLGRPIVSPDRTSPPYWQRNYIDNHLWLSAFHMRPDRMLAYIRALQRFEPKGIDGYPSTVHLLALYMQDNNIVFPSVKAVFTSSEPLSSAARNDIETAFNAPLYDYYGHAERAIFATQCSSRDGYHVNSDLGILEILDSNERRVSGTETGAMVATSLWNMAMPLLRYRVGDETSWLAGYCSCGCAFPLISGVSTKSEDRIVRPDGTVISASALTHPFKPLRSVAMSQIVQTAPDRIVIYIVPRGTFSDIERTALLSEFTYRVGPQFAVHVEVVEEIPWDKAKKFRWVVNQYSASAHRN